MHYCNHSYFCMIDFGFIIDIFPLIPLAFRSWPWPWDYYLGLGLEGIRLWPWVLGLGFDSAGLVNITGQHLSHGPRDLATLNFDLGHRPWRWYGSSCSICVPSFKFVGRHFRKLWHTFDLSISRYGYLDLWPFDLETGARCCAWGRQPSHRFWCFCDFLFSSNGPTPVIRTTWPRNLDLGGHGICRRNGSSFSIWIPSISS